MSRCTVLAVMLAVALMAMAWASPVRAQQLVVNGSFEDPAGEDPPISQNIDGWTGEDVLPNR